MENGKKILLIDDDPFILDQAKNILEENGFVVSLAINGSQGIKLAYQLHPALIFLDVEMPMIDGYKVLQTIKKDVKTKSIPVVLLTSVDLKRDKGKGLQLGADMFMNKPFSSLKLMSVVNAILKNKISFDW